MRKRKKNLIIILYLFFIAIIFGCSKKESKENSESKTEIKVVNLTNDSYDEYIGRGIEYHTHMLAKGIKAGEKGWLGNPHPIGWCDICKKYHTRIDCIKNFRKDFFKKINENTDFRKSIMLLKGKRLGCYCKPKECHGDVIKEWIEAQTENITK
jgi:hypothetical protein